MVVGWKRWMPNLFYNCLWVYSLSFFWFHGLQQNVMLPPFVIVPENNKGSFIALIELHTQVRRSNYFLDCVTSEMPQHLVCLSQRSGVRPELAPGPLMVLTPSFIQPEAAELRGLRISSPGNTNNLTREICLSLTHQQPSRQQEWWCASTLQSFWG